MGGGMKKAEFNRYLTGFWKIGVQLQKLPEIRIGFQGRMRGRTVHVTLQCSTASLDKLEMANFK